MQKLREVVRAIWDSTGARAVFVAATALLAIGLGFVISVFVTKDPDDAGRGGAFVVALSFYFIVRSSHRVPKDLADSAREYVVRLFDQENNLLLAIMSVLGTLAWGFLDIVAEQLIC